MSHDGLNMNSNSSMTTPEPLPRVLVLLATYNGNSWLREQIESILSQVGVAVQIHISDDSSSDGTPDTIATRWGADARVKLESWDERSGSAGANFRRLYRHADLGDFDFVALADQDDIWFPRKLISAIHALRRTGAEGYSSAVESFWPDGRTVLLSQNSVTRSADFLFEGAGQGCSFVMTVGLFARVKAYCISEFDRAEALHYHDWLIYLLARAWGESWFFDPLPSMRYRQHDGNEIGSRGGVNAASKRIYLMKSGWYRNQIVAALAIFSSVSTQDVAVNTVKLLLEQKDSLKRRCRLLAFTLIHSRRRWSDRVVLGFSAAFGWI